MFAGKAVGYSTEGTLTTTAAGHLGSTEITNTAGTISRQTYLPYGATRSSNSNALDTDHTYTGQIDDGTGLLHYRARQYDPQLGRFIQADDIVTDGLNRYTYVKNNPLGGIDPSGNETCAYKGGFYVCWSEVENISGVRAADSVCNAVKCDIAGEDQPPPEAVELGTVEDLIVLNDEGQPITLSAFAGDLAFAAVEESLEPLAGQYFEWNDGWINIRKDGVLTYYPSSGSTRTFRNFVNGRMAKFAQLRGFQAVSAAKKLTKGLQVVGLLTVAGGIGGAWLGTETGGILFDDVIGGGAQ